MSKPYTDKTKPIVKKFFCPQGIGIMWWHGLEYSECPLSPPYRDMPECKDCKLCRDKKWKDNKETWKDKHIKKKKHRPRKKKGNQGERR